MTDRPILFSGEMVRAILEGRKTQTRRVVKKPLWSPMPNDMFWTGIELGTSRGEKFAGCPYGATGDRLWVRETWALYGSMFYRADGEPGREELDIYPGWKWKPSIFMPRIFSRITLEITTVRVERLNNISGPDATAEGWPGPEAARYTALHVHGNTISGNAAIEWFAHLWNTINEKSGHGWETNPWVWVIEFEKVANVP